MSLPNQVLKSFQSNQTVTTVDLRTLGTPDRALDVGSICNLDIEVVGNAAAVTITAKGPFSTSEFFAVEDGVIPINGGKVSISGHAVAELKFTRTGTALYHINVCRQIVG